MNEVYITRLSKFFPNEAVSCEEMEEYLGMINNKKSRGKAIVLHNNGIKTRYYALDKSGKATHTNAEMTAEAVRNLLGGDVSEETIDILACGTSSPDQLLPAHASMVQGYFDSAMEVISPGGSCNAGMLGMKYAHMAIRSGDAKRVICAGSERFSAFTKSANFEEEAKRLEQLEKNPMIAFEKEFMRWMLSDGAGAALLEDKPSGEGISLRIDWIENRSYAHQLPTCMYAGGEKDKDSFISWLDFDMQQVLEKSLLSIKQDVKLLGPNIIKWGGDHLVDVLKKRNLNLEEIDFFLPHISSEFFRPKIKETLAVHGLSIADEKWFTNLTRVGNVGAASVYLMLEELFYSGRLNRGQKILVMNPESARFSYSYALFTVV